MQPPTGPSDLKFEDITKDELKKIQHSLKQPEFMGLLNEYMVEISDPKNREEYDQYLKQMQSEGQLPKHMKLVELTPEFCIRTTIVSDKNKKHNMKFFINFCSTDKIDQPLCQPTQAPDGKPTFAWKVPNSMGKIRYDQDKHGTPCQVADIAFHNQCYKIIHEESNMPFRKSQFKSMIITIGLQCAEKQLGERKETLSKDYDVLKNLKCKGGSPALLPMRYIKGKAYNRGEMPENVNQENGAIERDLEGKQTKLQREINQQKEKNALQKAEKQTLEKQQQDDDEMLENQLDDQSTNKKPLIQDLSQQGIVQQPKYSSIYTYPVDYSQFMQGPSHMTPSKIPSHFNIEFKLPRVENMEEITKSNDSLNINENRIILKIGEKYFIDLPFNTFKMKYQLLTDKIKAKFDKKKKVLKISIAIDQTIKYEKEIPQENNLLVREQIREGEGEGKGESEKEANQNQENGSAQQTLDGKIVENETWKDGVLEVSEPNVGVKLLEGQSNQSAQTANDGNGNMEQPQQPQKKLIEEIDEDDVVEEENYYNNSKVKTSQNTDGLQQDNSSSAYSKNQAFSISRYYSSKAATTKSPHGTTTDNQQKPQTQNIPQRLTHVFQQTNDKIVIVIKMQNYNKTDITFTYDKANKNSMFLVWDRNASSNNGEKKIELIKCLELRIASQDLTKEIKKVEAVFRVGFVAIFIEKKNKEKFWEKESIESVKIQSEEDYEGFKKRLSEVMETNKALDQEEMREIEQQSAAKETVESKTESTTKTQESSSGSNQLQTTNFSESNKDSSSRKDPHLETSASEATEKRIYSETDDDNKASTNVQMSVSKAKQEAEYFSLNNLPPQFIQFDMEFVQVLD